MLSLQEHKIDQVNNILSLQQQRQETNRKISTKSSVYKNTKQTRSIIIMLRLQQQKTNKKLTQNSDDILSLQEQQNRQGQ